MADFAIKINVVYDRELYFNIYIPAFLIDEGYLDYSGVLIGGEDYSKDEWKAVEHEGEMYYRALTGYIYEETARDDITVYIPFDYEDGTRVETRWIISLEKYFAALEENEVEYSDEVSEILEAVKLDFLTEEEADGENESDAEDEGASPDDGENETDGELDSNEGTEDGELDGEM